MITYYKDRCQYHFREFERRHGAGDPRDLVRAAQFAKSCRKRVGLANLSYVLALLVFSLIEGWLVSCVRSYGKELRMSRVDMSKLDIELEHVESSSRDSGYGD